MELQIIALVCAVVLVVAVQERRFRRISRRHAEQSKRVRRVLDTYRIDDIGKG